MDTIEKIWNWCEAHWQLITIAGFILLTIIGPIE